MEKSKSLPTKELFFQTILFLVSVPFLPFVLIYFCVFAGIRFLLWKYLQVQEKGIIRPISGRDAIFLMSDSERKLQTQPDCFITGSLIVEGKLSIGNFRNLILEKLVLAKVEEDGELKYPELQQSQVKRFGYWWWKWANKDFRIEDHVKLFENLDENETVTYSDLMKIIGKISNRSVDLAKPLWEILIVPNFQSGEPEGSPTDSTVIILRLSHSYWDGFSAFKMLTKELSDSGTDWIPVFTAPKSSFLDQLKLYSFVLFQLPYNAYKQFTLNDKNPLHSDSSHTLCDEWIATSSEKISLKPLKLLRENLGISFQGLLLASISSGIKKYLEESCGSSPEVKEINFQAPLPWPDHPNDKICNHWTGTFYKLPFLPSTLSKSENNNNSSKFQEQALETFNQVSKRTSRSTALVSNFHSANLCSLVPLSLVSPVCNLGGSTGTFSNMKGPPQELRICDKPLIELCFWLPVIMGQSLSISVVSYKNSFRIGIIARKSVIGSESQLEQLTQNISQSVENYCM